MGPRIATLAIQGSTTLGLQTYALGMGIMHHAQVHIPLQSMDLAQVGQSQPSNR